MCYLVQCIWSHLNLCFNLSQTAISLVKDQQNSTVARVLVTSLFFLWGFALNLNPILIPHLKRACQLNDLQSAFIDSASYIAYFLAAIPAGLFIRKVGYKGGITLGLLLFCRRISFFACSWNEDLCLFFTCPFCHCVRTHFSRDGSQQRALWSCSTLQSKTWT